MKLNINPNLKPIFIRDFNLCFFLSLIILALYQKYAQYFIDVPHYPYFKYLILPTINGLLTALITIPLNQFFSKKKYTRRYYTQDRLALHFVAFTAGFLSIYITISDVYTYLISALIIYLAYQNVLDFAAKLTALLEPDKQATPEDLGEFANFFITLVITFAVINLSINSIHYNFDLEPAFNFEKGGASIIDAIYFSIITMTTVGYGEIVPHNVIARAVVSLECLTSYLMLGIMIGIITRGVTFTKKD